MDKLKDIKGILFDLDGVFYVGNEVIPGAPETVEYLKEKGIACRYVTNTSTKSLDSLHQQLTGLGFSLERDEIVSAPYAAVLYLRRKQYSSCYLVMEDEVKQDFQEFKESDTSPDVVVVGDIGKEWNYEIMNRIFQLMMQGTQLIALHRNKFWQTAAGLQMDIGALVAGWEYATEKPALIIGKPSTAFFELSTFDLEISPEKLAIVGDDIDSDIGGGQAYGMKGVLVKTGKYRWDYVAASPVIPDVVLDSVTHLKECFD